MFKNASIVSLLMLLLLYIGLVMAIPTTEDLRNLVCETLQIDIRQGQEDRYIAEKEIEQILKRAGFYPIGKKYAEINTAQIEDALETSSLIRKAECYKTTGGRIKLKIYQRTPILRVIADRGNYYVDTEGKKMPLPAGFSAYVPVATGCIEDSLALGKLYHFALFLRDNKFWNAQIEQIHVAPNLDVELTPRVGSHQIILGKIENYKENLDKLRLFYKKGLNKTGWNRYSKINLKYRNQVVCEKKQ
jgi:cell division protein FtsQ